jgi:hypothetical protein
MIPDPAACRSAETAYVKQLCEDSRELRRTSEQLRISSQELRLLCRVAVSRAKASRASSVARQALNCVT